MPAMKHQVALNKSREFFFDLKMATRFLVSVSVFSIFVSYSSLLPFLLNSFKLSFSAYKSIDKNYVFLLCNGILVFIFKNSGAFSSNSPQKPEAVSSGKIIRKKIDKSQTVELSQMKESTVEKKVVQETLALVPVTAENKQQDTKNLVLVPVSTAEDKQQDTKKLALVPVTAEDKQQQEDEFEDEEGNGSMSREELNKKCDEFIRKMKEAIRFQD